MFSCSIYSMFKAKIVTRSIMISWQTQTLIKHVCNVGSAHQFDKQSKPKPYHCRHCDWLKHHTYLNFLEIYPQESITLLRIIVQRDGGKKPQLIETLNDNLFYAECWLRMFVLVVRFSITRIVWVFKRLLFVVYNSIQHYRVDISNKQRNYI